MAKKVDPLKAKQAKQKKIVIVLGVLFAAMLAFQGPKTLKMLKGPPQAPAVEASAVPTPVSSTSASGVVPPGTPGEPATAAGAPAPDGEVQPAVLVDSDLPVAAGAGQLLSFEQFESVDPFDQQIDDAAVAAPQSSASKAKPEVVKAEGATSSGGQSSGGQSSEGQGAGSNPGGSVVPGSAGGSMSAGGGSAPTSAAPTPATATKISLNGAVMDLVAAAEFPVDDPTFVFVSAAQDGKSIEIGIAGGVYADGDETITLKIGKPLTLQNTADGSRYELKLLSVQGFVPPQPAK